MAVEIKVPSLGESVNEVTVAKWLKSLGEVVTEGDPLVELETDKATQEIYAPKSGLLISISAPVGATLKIGASLGKIGGDSDVSTKMSSGDAPSGPVVPPVSYDLSAAESLETIAANDPEPFQDTNDSLGDSAPESDKISNTESDTVASPELESLADFNKASETDFESGSESQFQSKTESNIETGTESETEFEPEPVTASSPKSLEPESLDPESLDPESLDPESLNSGEELAAATTEESLDTHELDTTENSIDTDDSSETSANRAAFVEPPVVSAPNFENESQDYSSDNSSNNVETEVSSTRFGKQMPAVERMLAEHKLDSEMIPATGRDGRLTKEDILNFLEKRHLQLAKAKSQSQSQLNTTASLTSLPESEFEEELESLPSFHAAPTLAATITPQPIAPSSVEAAPTEAVPDTVATPTPPQPATPPIQQAMQAVKSGEERVRMTRLRQKIAERLKESQNTAAMLTSFNEVDMSAVIALRSLANRDFESKHGVKLGFMSLFAKAAIIALKEFPAINAEIDGTDIIYKHYYDLGIAVGTDRGLVVPVVRNADQLSCSEIEKQIADMGQRARNGKLKLEEMTGGSFTITNGGVYGSLMSTPILNPPQSGILGMHKIAKRPIVVTDASGGDSIAIRPMMYLALTYDHRLVDGREAVSFLVRLKEVLEHPEPLSID